MITCLPWFYVPLWLKQALRGKIVKFEALILNENQQKLLTIFHKLEKFIVGSFSVSFKTIESKFEW